MARHVKVHQEEEETTTEQAEAGLEGGAVGVPDVANKVDGAEVAMSNRVFTPSTAKQHQVMQTARINGTGGITHLHAGQIIDENNYDIDGLKRSGVKLQPFDPDAQE